MCLSSEIQKREAASQVRLEAGVVSLLIGAPASVKAGAPLDVRWPGRGRPTGAFLPSFSQCPTLYLHPPPCTLSSELEMVSLVPSALEVWSSRLACACGF